MLLIPIVKGKTYLCTFIYNMNFRKTTPWTMGGDFKIIRNNLKKIKGEFVAPSLIEEFNNYLPTLGLIELNHIGNHMT